MKVHLSAFRFVLAFVTLAAVPTLSHAAPLLVTTTAGHLVFEALEGHGATANLEFGLGTPATDSTPAERMRIFTIHLVDEHIGSVTPGARVDLGVFASGTALDFYNLSDFSGVSWAFSRDLDSTPSAADLEVFRDRDNSLGLGGSIVETIGVDHWILHLDDAASVDDDDNEMIIDVRVRPAPEPATLTLLLAGAAAVAFRRRKRLAMSSLPS
jgi:PEP-CTERM motif